ncbi:MAG: hypothetical protein ACLGIN_04560 [Candidatus Sericytochromatia bacterium]
MRRSRLHLLDDAQGLEAVEVVARLMGETIQKLEDWDDEAREQWIAQEIATYRAAIAHSRSVREQVPSGLSSH